MSDDLGHDEVQMDGSHKVEHTTEQKHWATRAAEREGAPQQVNPERNQSWATPAQQGREKTTREKLSAYAHGYGQQAVEQLKDRKQEAIEYVKGTPRRVSGSAADTIKRGIEYSNSRTDDAMKSFVPNPVQQVRQGREIRRHMQEKYQMIREQQAEGTRAVPTPRHPRRELTQSGLNLLNEGFAPAPIMGFDAIHGSRATGRKRKRDVGPGDLLL